MTPEAEKRAAERAERLRRPAGGTRGSADVGTVPARVQLRPAHHAERL